ncbi:MAG TPA: hypothetical protein VFG23_20670 [Polyangia bacterium]|nr:hypothetical protein [Polyangia bacterium]
MATEGASDVNAETCAAAAWQVYEKLNARLSSFLGSAGVQALFARSAKLARAEFPSLADVVGPDGMTKLGVYLQALEPAVAIETAATLFGTFIDLITTFIGERLAILVLRSAWPTIEDMRHSGRPKDERPRSDSSAALGGSRPR